MQYPRVIPGERRGFKNGTFVVIFSDTSSHYVLHHSFDEAQAHVDHSLETDRLLEEWKVKNGSRKMSVKDWEKINYR